MKSLQNQLWAWKNQQRKQPTQNSDHTAVIAQHNPYTHSGKLQGYVAIVEFPLRRGGGWSYYKSASAAKLYESMPDHKVTWL